MREAASVLCMGRLHPTRLRGSLTDSDALKKGKGRREAAFPESNPGSVGYFGF